MNLPHYRVFLLAAAAMAMGAFLYDVIFAGIPYQDPTPAQSAAYARHARVAAGMMVVAAGLSGTGVVLLVVRRFRRGRAGK